MEEAPKRKEPSSKNYSFISKVNLLRAETKVIKHLIDVKLIKIATHILDVEHGALASAFEQVASDQQVQAFVHPQQ